MTIVVRRVAGGDVQDLGAAGVCRVSFGVIVGVFGKGFPWRVLFLEAEDLGHAA